nr:receptor-type tyrosine-protein phosphatase T-like [Hydra vulgaris]
MLMLAYYIWFYHGAYVHSQKLIEKFELVECEARSIILKWQLNNATPVKRSIVSCSRFDGREETSTQILYMTGFVTINNLAPNTKYKCKLEVYSLSIGSMSSDFVYAETLIGDACIQPVGFETGIIKENNVISSSATNSKKKSIRLYDADGFWCSADSNPYIRIDLERIMTITGLLIRTNNNDIDTIYLMYGIKNEMQYIYFDDTWKNQIKRTFDSPKNGTTRHWFLENSFTVKLLQFISLLNKTPFCVQVEVYGCSEICSSKLKPLSVYHILQPNTSISNNTKLLNPENVSLSCIEINQSLRFDFGKISTLSGFMMLSENVFVNIRVRYGDIIENMTLKHEASQTFSANPIPHSYTTFWFNDQILTRYIEVRPVSEITCMYVVFLGCKSANMKKLGIENESPDIILTESSFNNLGNKAVKGRLNAMSSDWTVSITDKNPWYQICFQVIQTVSAIAVQGQGYWNIAYITEYSIIYGYSANTVSYDYSINGLPYRFNGTKNRYATSVSQFPVEISVQCLRIVNIKFYHTATGRFEVLGDNITYPPNITMPKLVFNIKNSTAIVKCVVIGQPGLLIQWRKQNEIIVDNKIHYIIKTSDRSTDVNGTYTSELEINPLVHLNIDNDDTQCHGDKKNVSCFFYYSISTGYTVSNLFVTNTTLIYYGFNAEIDLPNLTIVATNFSINITWTTEQIERDFQVFYNFLLIKHDGSNKIILDNKTSIKNTVMYNAKLYTSYTFQLIAFNRLGIYQKVEKKISLEELLKNIKKGGTSSGVTGGVTGTVACVIVLLAVLGILRKRKKKHDNIKGIPYKFKKEEECDNLETLEPVSAFENPLTDILDENLDKGQYFDEEQPIDREQPSVARLQLEVQQKKTEVLSDKKLADAIVIDSNHPPISLKDFPKHWDWLQKDSNYALSEEYKCLNAGQLYTWNDALLPEVNLKNRYANILAYDHSRVRLGNSSDVKTNYINASFIHGYTKPNVYIATQGPNTSSLNDFWRMIWEQDVSLIVMLTNLVERQKKKCELYWPRYGGQIFDDVEVNISSTDNFSDYVVRKFSVKKVGSDEKKLVYHFQFLNWPDHRVPEFVFDIVHFCQHIRKVFPYEHTQNPVVVHCSTGGGRTGAYICIDEMLELVKYQNKVDIFNYVNFMRSRRISMIQSEDQYLFVYRAIFESITCGVTETIASKFPQLITGLSNETNLNLGATNGFEEQFQKLKMFISSPVPEEFSNALKDVNKEKNRNQQILPSDEKRVILLDDICKGGDYINAVYINGYKKRNEYIATQHPLASTLSDFWTMVLQKKIGTIVMLHDSHNESRLPNLHGALKHRNDFKNVSVTLKHQKNNGCITFKSIQVSSLNGKDNVECVILCLEWPIDGVPVKNEAIMLINEMEKQQSKHGENPILVFCSDGASRCGTFLACSIILQYLQLEQAVDVFQTIRKIRTSRSQFVDNVVHFRFCYELASTYIKSFDCYSNYVESKI